MKHLIDAVYENGAFRPIHPSRISIAAGQQVCIAVDDKEESDVLKLAISVYDGLSDGEIDEIEKISFDRSNFFGSRNID